MRRGVAQAQGKFNGKAQPILTTGGEAHANTMVLATGLSRALTVE